jgi:hypothetical protein
MPRSQPPQPKTDATQRVATTVKLDTVRHRRLRLLGIDEGRSSQAILVDALDAYLAAHECENPRRRREQVSP